MLQTKDPTDQTELSDIGLDSFAPYLMNRIMGRYNSDLHSEITAAGLSVPKLRALAILSVKDGLPIGEIGVFAVVEQSTMSRAMDDLFEKGFVRREVDSEDRRSNRIYLTQAGRAAFMQVWPKMRTAHTGMFADIEEAERDAFLRTLRKVLANVRIHEI